MAAKGDDRLVKLAVARDEIEANVWRSVLEQDGLAVLVRNVDPLGSIAAAPTPAFSFELMVAASDEKRARWLLGQL